MIKRVAVLPDTHLPFESKRSVAAVEKYLVTEKWDEVILLGDLLDFDEISSHNVTNLRAVEGKTIQKTYDYANRYLDRLQKIVDGAKITFLEGNHDFRVERLIDACPRLRGSIEVEK